MNLVLNLTEQCNLRCSYCYYAETQPERLFSMSEDTLERAIALGWQRSLDLGQRFLNITFFGGEPLLCKERILLGMELARHYQPKDTKLRFAVNTNGTLLDEFWLNLFAKENFRVFLSLDGPREVHDAQRSGADGTGSFDRIAPWIPRLTCLDTVVIRVITKHHLNDIASSVKWIHEQGFSKITTAVDFDGKWTGDAMDALAREYRTLAAFWVQRKKASDPFYLGVLQDKMRLELENMSYKKKTCHILEGALAVSAKGDLFPCTRFVSCAPNAPYRLGSVFTGVDESTTEEIRHHLTHDKECCGDCALKTRCIAHECACISFYTTGGLSDVSAEVCAHERMLAEICDAAALELMNTP